MATLQRCLQIREKSWGKGDLRTVDTLEDLAQTAETEADFSDAEGFLKRGLTIRQHALPPDSLEVTGSLEKLAAYYHRRGREGEAKSLYEQAAKTWDRLLRNPEPAEDYIHRGALTYLALGLLKRSEVLLDRSLKMRIALYGPVHPRVALCMEDL